MFFRPRCGSHVSIHQRCGNDMSRQHNGHPPVVVRRKERVRRPASVKSVCVKGMQRDAHGAFFCRFQRSLSSGCDLNDVFYVLVRHVLFFSITSFSFFLSFLCFLSLFECVGLQVSFSSFHLSSCLCVAFVFSSFFAFFLPVYLAVPVSTPCYHLLVCPSNALFLPFSPSLLSQ